MDNSIYDSVSFHSIKHKVGHILNHMPEGDTLYQPFAESAALNRAIAHRFKHIVLGEVNKSLVAAWETIINDSEALKGKTSVVCADYREMLEAATHNDVVYIDTGGRSCTTLIDTLHDLTSRRIPYVVCAAARTSDLPTEMVTKHEIHPGVEVLFVSRPFYYE